MDLGILNTVIALVIVLLVLSLLVQAIQTLLKKLLKLKSRQIEGSLKDLYEQVVGMPTAEVEAAPPNPRLTAILNTVKRFLGMKINVRETAADVFKNKVLDQFKNIGRKTLFGNAVLDSLSKGDLFKVMGKLESEDFFPDYVQKFQALCDRIEDLRQAVEAISEDQMLRGSASTKIAEIRSILAPIFNNVSAILEGTQVKPGVLFADLLRLQKLDVHGLLRLVDEAQAAVARETEIATAAGNTGEVAALQNLSKQLAEVAKLIGDLSQKFVDAVSPLRNKIEQVELWFDTVTQSFDERYARHMRTASIVISIIVVIVLNANFFNVYKNLSSNEVQRNLIVDKGPEILERSRQVQAQASPTPTPANIEEALQQSRQEIEILSSSYQGFGFTPVTLQQLQSFAWSLGLWTIVSPDHAGNRSVWGMALVEGPENVYKWQSQTPGQWWQSRKTNVATLVGWAIMVMLLSVGAPFWQDALESLFGIKNLLRQKTATQNVESQSGTGQPRE
ncbi:MAG TPA: hypothetical protein VKB02_03985 [Pyrinomonadaceae bacterium]|nr:hypothetical protein [Pyrinomonadaceae bacterium]